MHVFAIEERTHHVAQHGSGIVYRQLSTAGGKMFSVPGFILRMDEANFHGWQLRNGERIGFSGLSDADGSVRALHRAVEELLERVAYRGK